MENQQYTCILKDNYYLNLTNVPFKLDSLTGEEIILLKYQALPLSKSCGRLFSGYGLLNHEPNSRFFNLWHLYFLVTFEFHIET